MNTQVSPPPFDIPPKSADSSPPPSDTSLIPFRTRLRREISRGCASAIGSTVFATCSVVGASVVSVCSGTILKQCASLWDGSLAEGYLTTITALIFSAIAIGVLWFRERGISDVTNVKEADLQRQQNLMEGRLTSMPPKDFVYEYIMALRRTGELRMQSKNEFKLGHLTSAQVRERIRSILETVVVLTRMWDGVSRIRDHVVYRASLMTVVIPEQLGDDSPLWRALNVGLGSEKTENSDEQPSCDSGGTTESVRVPTNEMGRQVTRSAPDSERPLFRPVQNKPHAMLFRMNSRRPISSAEEGTDETWAKWVLKSPFFLHRQSQSVAWERCTGAVAVTDPGLSSSSDPKALDPQPIVLPYTLLKDYKVGTHHPNFPGAPFAAATGQPSYIDDLSKTIKNWLDKELEVNPEVTKKYVREITDYYGGLQDISSLISVPVLINEKLGAILNIQKSNESLLYNHERADMFIHFMNPICYHLGRMLLLMYSVDANSAELEERG